MRILLLTQILPYPPDSGPRIKTYNLLQYLAQEHEVTLVSLVRSPEEAGRAEQLLHLCAAVHTVPLPRSRLRDIFYLMHSLRSGLPFVIVRDACEPLRQLLIELTRQTHFDIVHADQLNMAQFALDLPCDVRVLDQHNAVWTIVQRMAQHNRLGPKRIFMDREARLLRRYEAQICACFDGVLAVSESDRWALDLAKKEMQEFNDFVVPPSGGCNPPPEGGTTNCSFEVVPIAVDTQTQPVVQCQPDARTILSMATMFWPPNVDGVLWFSREIYPLVQQQVPDVRFAVVGARPPRSVRSLAEADESIEVTGYVDDPQPHLAASAALIVPVRAGGGMRVKILEALARGIPIVSTTVGYEGIDLVPGVHLLVADTPEDFAAALVRLLRSPALRQALADAGRALVQQRYDWRVVNPQVGALYTQLTVETRGRKELAFADAG